MSGVLADVRILWVLCTNYALDTADGNTSHRDPVQLRRYRNWDLDVRPRASCRLSLLCNLSPDASMWGHEPSSGEFLACDTSGELSALPGKHTLPSNPWMSHLTTSHGPATELVEAFKKRLWSGYLEVLNKKEAFNSQPRSCMQSPSLKFDLRSCSNVLYMAPIQHPPTTV